MKKIRVDDLLINQGFFATKDQVVRAVIAREVRINDVYVKSPAEMVSPEANVFVKHRKRYVSRGGFKLEAALQHFSQDVSGLTCIDVGSSTGGFTDCLLQAGACEVTCVDVNYGQLAWEVRSNPRVKVFERTNIRRADPALLGAPFDVVVCDVSFIGLARLAGVFASLCKEGSVFIGLIKPQFESRHEETESGVVKSEAVRQRVQNEVAQALLAHGFDVNGCIASPLKGPQGNIEYLIHATYKGSSEA